MRFSYLFFVLLLLPGVAQAQVSKGNRLAYLDELDPYYVSRTFPKLITPQWVGEEGVEAVVTLAIDDMRDHKKYESYLRPILNRLKQIDGRAPVSIMTCSIDPKEPHLQQWLKEGLSLEVHTFDHPCPFFKGGSFAKAKETYDKCVDLMAAIPGSKPVCFRMPCCDSLNTPSPRFWAEIFNKTTPPSPPAPLPPEQGRGEKRNPPSPPGGEGSGVRGGNFLTLDSSVFHLFTSDDPDLPRELVLEKDGSEKFRKYLPKDRTFVNTIENYPYPYVIGGLCWQFPCMGPSDWSAQHLQGKNNPVTIEDWKCALDATVIKQGVFNMVFHPHGWIKADQIVDFIDYAVTKHGKKVKFLTFKEAEERLNKHLLAGQPLRDPKSGIDNGVRLLDVNNDGYLDVVIGNDTLKQTRIWSPKEGKWNTTGFPNTITYKSDVISYTIKKDPIRFGILQSNGFASYLFSSFDIGSPQLPPGHWYHFDGKLWVHHPEFFNGLRTGEKAHYILMNDGFVLRDLDGDGICELIVSTPWDQAVLKWSAEKKQWTKLPFTLPGKATIVDKDGHDNGTRFIDINEDGHLDVVFSNEKEYGVYLFTDMKKGWSQKVIAGKAGDKGALPMIASKGTNFGMWVHSRSLWWGNETTPLLKDHVDRVSFNDLLKNVEPKPKSPQASLQSMKPRPGFTVELVATEPPPYAGP